MLAFMAFLVLAIWTTLFWSTYRYPFFWDDYHCIRPYSTHELLSTFHGWDDPDKVETPALRPMAALLFAFQGVAFGENVVLHKIFETVLMWFLLFLLGLLLTEFGFKTFQIGIVFALFVFSRVFATLNMWLIQGSLIFSYAFMIFTILLFVHWIKRGNLLDLWLMAMGALVAIFTREEAYTLCVVALLIWVLLPEYRQFRRRAVIASACLLAIALLHIALRARFVPEAPSPKFTLEAFQNFWVTIKSSWFPCGYMTIGFTDDLFAYLWMGFLFLILVLFVRIARPLRFWQTAGVCCLGVLLASPAIAVAHSYGLALPALAFRAAIAMAVAEILRQMHVIDWFNARRRHVVECFVVVGLMVGIVGGVLRSMYVAEALHQNCALRMLFDANFVYDLYQHPTTVPQQRREDARSRFAAAGIVTLQDLQRVYQRCSDYDPEYVKNRETRKAPFLPKYSFNSY
jgi:hypothetical protein